MRLNFDVYNVPDTWLPVRSKEITDDARQPPTRLIFSQQNNGNRNKSTRWQLHLVPLTAGGDEA
jgi:hypothetical protein